MKGSLPVSSEAPNDVSRHEQLVDEIDMEIIALIDRRVRLAQQRTADRTIAGSSRSGLSRENEILRRYHDALGAPGTRLAMTLIGMTRNP